jgi:membrane-bound lytic murein transglycosylase D
MQRYLKIRSRLLCSKDSLYSIAKKYPGITISDIKKWNDIRDEKIKPGMKLKISG